MKKLLAVIGVLVVLVVAGFAVYVASRQNLKFAARKLRDTFLGLVTPGFLFESLGFQYVGPIDGHNIAELASMDLSQGRSIAMVRCAREVAHGRADLSDPEADRRLLAISEIGPWTMQCLGLHGRGDLDSLPAGDLAYVKLVGHLESLGRRATVEEVEEYFAPYAPYRGLAGAFALVGWHKAMGAGPPARLVA